MRRDEVGFMMAPWFLLRCTIVNLWYTTDNFKPRQSLIKNDRKVAAAW